MRPLVGYIVFFVFVDDICVGEKGQDNHERDNPYSGTNDIRHTKKKF